MAYQVTIETRSGLTHVVGETNDKAKAQRMYCLWKNVMRIPERHFEAHGLGLTSDKVVAVSVQGVQNATDAREFMIKGRQTYEA